MTPNEALQYLRAQGCHAEERDWELGETILVGYGETTNEYGIRMLQRVIFLVPAGAGWTLFDFEQSTALSTTGVSLKEACEQVVAVLRGDQGAMG